MGFGNNTFTDAGGAVSDLLQGQATAAGLRLKSRGDQVEAGNYLQAADLADKNAQFADISTKLKEVQDQRKIYQSLGRTEADVAGAGFSMSGSALDLMRDSASQGALTKAVATEQGQITEAGYQEQASAYRNLASYAQFAGAEEDSMANKAITNGEISAGIKGVAAIGTLFF